MGTFAGFSGDEMSKFKAEWELLNPRCSLLIFLLLSQTCSSFSDAHTCIHNTVLTQILPLSCLRTHWHTHTWAQTYNILITLAHTAFTLTCDDQFTCKLASRYWHTHTNTHKSKHSYFFIQTFYHTYLHIYTYSEQDPYCKCAHLYLHIFKHPPPLLTHGWFR